MSATSTMTAGMTGMDRCGDVEDGYDRYLTNVQNRFTLSVGNALKGPLFVAKVEGLYDAYIAAAPEAEQKHRACNACKRFIEKYGALVTIDDEGRTASAIWDVSDAPEAYKEAARRMKKIVEQGSIEGVFLSSDRVWGTPKTRSDKAPGGAWTHFAVVPPVNLLHNSRLLTADQKAAERREERGMLGRGIEEFGIDLVRQAHAYLTNGQLYRSEKCVGVAKWFLDLHDKLASLKSARARDNYAWRAAASAPVGYTHIKSSMIGTLLEDLASGMDFGTVKERFDAKMNPLQYQRPQAAPAAGNIKVAEALIDKLGSRRSFERRFAKLSDVETIWTPKVAKAVESKASGGMFDHLQPKNAKGKAASIVNGGVVTMTFVKFQKEVLPHAEKIEFAVPTGSENYTAMVTAEHLDAPPIIQWDREDRRNPVSWYTYSMGSSAERWNLRGGARAEVTALVLQPSMWGVAEEQMAHQGKGVMFALRGAYDTQYTGGAGLFPELLKSEYHAVRSTLEAFIRAFVMSNATEAEVCGPRINSGDKGSNVHVFYVTSKGVETAYKLDRWD